MNGILGDENGVVCHHGMMNGCEVCSMFHLAGCECGYCAKKNGSPFDLVEININMDFFQEWNK